MVKLSNKIVEDYDLNKLDTFMKNKNLQFKLDCGVIMAVIDYKLESPIGLYFHYENTPNFDQFILSIEAFLKFTNKNLTSNDKNKLSNVYKNYIQKISGNSQQTMSQNIIDFLMNK